MKNIPMIAGFALLLGSAILLAWNNTRALYVDAAVLLLAIIIYLVWRKQP